MIIHIIVFYYQNISLIFYVEDGSHVRLWHPSCVYITVHETMKSFHRKFLVIKIIPWHRRPGWDWPDDHSWVGWVYSKHPRGFHPKIKNGWKSPFLNGFTSHSCEVIDCKTLKFTIILFLEKSKIRFSFINSPIWILKNIELCQNNEKTLHI